MLTPWQQSLIRGLFHYSAKRRAIRRGMAAKDGHVPDRLYKYRHFAEQHLQALEKDELWLSSPNRFNDPFDTAVCYDLARLRIDDRKPADMVADIEEREAALAAGKVPAPRPIARPMPTGPWLEREMAAVTEGLPPAIRERLTAGKSLDSFGIEIIDIPTDA